MPTAILANETLPLNVRNAPRSYVTSIRTRAGVVTRHFAQRVWASTRALLTQEKRCRQNRTLPNDDVARLSRAAFKEEH
jgi:hypothetical protein